MSHLNIFVKRIDGAPIRLTSRPDDVCLWTEGSAQFDRPRRLTAETDTDVPRYFWKGNHHILFLQDQHGNEHYHLWRVKVDEPSSGAEDLTQDAAAVDVIDQLEGISATDILIDINCPGTDIFNPYRLNVETGKMQPLFENRFGAERWVVDHAGRILAAVARNAVESTLLTRSNEHAEFHEVLKTTFPEMVRPLGYTPDNKNLYAVSNRGRDTTALVTLDPETGNETSEMFHHKKVDIWGVEFSTKRRIPIYVTFIESKTNRTFFDPKLESVYEVLSREFPGHPVWVTGHDAAERRFIIAVENDGTPGTRYFFDRGTGRFKKLAEISPSLSPTLAAPTTVEEYPTSDGLMIQGYLTLPRNHDRSPLPTVIFPHGGPWGRDNFEYNPDVQFLANRGYAVLRMNFRGSVGFGRKFCEAGFKQWGGKMQDDVTAGVQWLVNRGTTDPKRIAIYGESYGGYSALAGVTFTPDLYRAAVDRAGPTNLLTLLGPLPAIWTQSVPELYVKIGDPRQKQDNAMLSARSPSLHANQVKAAVFISHGENDKRVSIEQSKEMVAGLKQSGRSIEFHPVPTEGHVYQSESARIEFHEKMAEFLEKYLR